MNPEFLKRIFNGYEREEDVSHIQGTGLGMYITKSFIDLMKGTIEVESEKGKGTEFIINLHLDQGEIIEENSNEDELIKQADFSPFKVLIVDDNEINREIATLALENYNFNIAAANNGLEAFNTIKASSIGEYDIILMDVNMPVMNGFESTHEIRNLHDARLANIPIIALSANAFAEDVQKSMEAGMNAHVAKPINIDELIKIIYELLKEHHKL